VIDRGRKGGKGRHHLVEVGINIFGWDVAIFFEQLAGVGSEVAGEVFVVPWMFFGAPGVFFRVFV
jgi:hypothetical protein